MSPSVPAIDFDAASESVSAPAWDFAAPQESPFGPVDDAQDRLPPSKRREELRGYLKAGVGVSVQDRRLRSARLILEDPETS